MDFSLYGGPRLETPKRRRLSPCWCSSPTMAKFNAVAEVTVGSSKCYGGLSQVLWWVVASVTVGSSKCYGEL